MKLGISSYTYTWAVGVPGHTPTHPLSAFDLLDRAEALGVRLVQIADNLPLHALSLSELSALAGRADAAGIDIEVGTRGIAPVHVRTYLDLATGLGSRILRDVVDTADHQPSPHEVVTILQALAPELKAADVILAIENHDRFSCGTLMAILERVASLYVGICLDTANSFGALEGPDTVVRSLGPWTVNLHVKDFAIARAPHQMGFAIEGRPAGKGRLDVPWLLDTLQSMGRDVNAVLELWTPPEPTLAATIAKEAAWAEESVAHLRRFIQE